jgi:hypothetical protein
LLMAHLHVRHPTGSFAVPFCSRQNGQVSPSLPSFLSIYSKISCYSQPMHYLAMVKTCFYVL